MIKGLEALQELRKLSNNQHWIGQRFATSHLDIIEKELKTLEIIKERPLLALVDYNYTYEEWLALLEEDEINPFKSQQEYDLLKEVLI